MAKLKKWTKARKEMIDTLSDAFEKGTILKLSDDFITHVPCDIYHNCLDEAQKEMIIERLFCYYRDKGFPYFELTDKEILKEHKQFMDFDCTRLILDNNELNQSMHGLKITNSFFPNMWDVKCRKSLSPKEVFDDDGKFLLSITKRIKMSDTPMLPYNIRKSIKIFGGAQSVSAFRPSIAKVLINILFGDEPVSILDPCMGWGGRMYGFTSCDNVKKYEGFDVCKDTIKGLRNLRDKLFQLKMINAKTEIKIHQKPFEDAGNLIQDKFDFVMTSPPYFDVEKYSNDPDQSFLRYPTYDKWLKGFLRPMIEISYDRLNKGGYLALNISNDKLYDDTYSIINNVFGCSLKTVYMMRISKLCGRGVDKMKDKFKHEPIIVAQRN